MEVIQFKMIFRGWQRNRIYTVVSMLSLIVGLTCSVLLTGFVVDEFRTARSVPDSDRLYLLQEQSSFYNGTCVIKNSTSAGSCAIQIREYFPEVENYCVFHFGNMQLMTDDKPEYMGSLYEVTSTFPDFFHPVVIAGDLKATLSNQSEIAVTNSFAKRRFGAENPIGKLLKFQVRRNVVGVSGFYQETVEKVYSVTSVIDDSQRGFLHYELLMGLPEEEIAPTISGWTNAYYTFLKLGEKVDAGRLGDRLSKDTVFTEYYQIRNPFYLLPMEEVYFSADQRAELMVNRDKSLLYVGGSVALAILLIACFNYINISMTRTLQRLQNTSRQLVYGASRDQIYMQLVAEMGLQVVISFGVAILFIYKILPVFNEFMGSGLHLATLFSGATFWIVLLLLAVLIVLPSFYIFSKLNAVSLNNILKQEHRSRSELITGMVVAQFAVSAVLLILVLNIRNQMDFIVHSRPESGNILEIRRDTEDKLWSLFKEQLVAIPEVTDYTSGSILSQGAVSYPGLNAMMMMADHRFVHFFGLKVLQGKSFVEGVKNRNEVLVNETLVKKWKIDDPIGHRFTFNGDYIIIGVVNDFMIDNFSREIQPLIIESNPEDWKKGWSTVVRIEEGMTDVAVGKMQALWKKIAPSDHPFKYKTMAEVYLNLHESEQRIMQMVSVFTWISLLLTCLGLFGLACYSVENRTKEIGLRKINGATEWEVVLLLCGRFLKWIGIAFVIAVPVAWYLTEQWMMQFIYKADRSVWIFVLAAVFILIVGMATVVWQSWHAAMVNPVESLKRD